MVLRTTLLLLSLSAVSPEPLDLYREFTRKVVGEFGHHCWWTICQDAVGGVRAVPQQSPHRARAGPPGLGRHGR
eukprot:10812315-Lingulodinium_polyedra.AAC.1